MPAAQEVVGNKSDSWTLDEASPIRNTPFLDTYVVPPW